MTNIFFIIFHVYSNNPVWPVSFFISSFNRSLPDKNPSSNFFSLLSFGRHLGDGLPHAVKRLALAVPGFMQQAHHVIPIADLPEQEDFVQHVDESDGCLNLSCLLSCGPRTRINSFSFLMNPGRFHSCARSILQLCAPLLSLNI